MICQSHQIATAMTITSATDSEPNIVVISSMEKQGPRGQLVTVRVDTSGNAQLLQSYTCAQPALCVSAMNGPFVAASCGNTLQV